MFHRDGLAPVVALTHVDSRGQGRCLCGSAAFQEGAARLMDQRSAPLPHDWLWSEKCAQIFFFWDTEKCAQMAWRIGNQLSWARLGPGWLGHYQKKWPTRARPITPFWQLFLPSSHAQANQPFHSYPLAPSPSPPGRQATRALAPCTSHRRPLGGSSPYLTSPHFTSLQDRFRLPAKPSFPTRASISKNSQPIKPWRCLKTSAASCRPPKRSSESYRPTADQAFDPTRRKKQRTPGPCRRRRRRTTAARGTGRAACTGATSAPARSA